MTDLLHVDFNDTVTYLGVFMFNAEIFIEIFIMSIVAFPCLGCFVSRCWFLRFFGAIFCYLQSSTSPPRGNQVDGLPRVCSLGMEVLGSMGNLGRPGRPWATPGPPGLRLKE